MFLDEFKSCLDFGARGKVEGGRMSGWEAPLPTRLRNGATDEED
jgi:hypothetical protein